MSDLSHAPRAHSHRAPAHEPAQPASMGLDDPQQRYGNAFLRDAIAQQGSQAGSSLLTPDLVGLLDWEENVAAAKDYLFPEVEAERQVDVASPDLGECLQPGLAAEAAPEQLPAQHEAAGRDAGGGVQLLVGGPYVDSDGDNHRYGHVALRVFDAAGERDSVFDFGRYGDISGPFSAEGEGVMREWGDGPEAYLAKQNSTGRETTGYTFPASPEEIERAFAFYDAQIEAGERGEQRAGHLRHTLPRDYNGVHNNCTTQSIDGFEAARPDLDLDVAEHNQGRGLNAAERLGAHNIAGWNDEIFMPADLLAVLEAMDTDEALIERWAPRTRDPYEVLQDPGLTCAQPELTAQVGGDDA